MAAAFVVTSLFSLHMQDVATWALWMINKAIFCNRWDKAARNRRRRRLYSIDS